MCPPPDPQAAGALPAGGVDPGDEFLDCAPRGQPVTADLVAGKAAFGEQDDVEAVLGEIGRGRAAPGRRDDDDDIGLVDRLRHVGVLRGL